MDSETERELGVLERDRRIAELHRQYQTEDFKAAASTPSGRAVLWRILDVCGVHRASFTGDANHTFFREGQRKVGQQIYAMFAELPDGDDLLFKMQQEAKQREEDLKAHD